MIIHLLRSLEIENLLIKNGQLIEVNKIIVPTNFN